MTTPVATEAIRVNGVDLSQLTSNAESLAGLLKTPPKRGANTPVPGGHGQLRRRNKLFDQADYVLPMWVMGIDPATGGPVDPYTSDAVFLARIDELVTLFSADEVVIEHDLPDGTTRHAVCEVLDSLEPERQPGMRTFGKVPIALVNPGAFWTETTPKTMSFTVATGTTLTLTEWDGATAPMDQMVYEFGPCSNPELGQPLVASYMAYDQAIAAGRKLTVDTVAWRLHPADGEAWTPDYRYFRHGGAKGNWFQIRPELGGPKIVFTHEGGGTATVTITGPRRFLSG